MGVLLTRTPGLVPGPMPYSLAPSMGYTTINDMPLVGASVSVSTVKCPRPLASATQVAMYDTYLAGLSFYLRRERPVWLITHGRKKRTFLGNYYAIGKRADPLTPWGKAILDFDEFKKIWKTTELPLRIIVKEKNLRRLTKEVGESPSRLAAIDEYLLVSKP